MGESHLLPKQRWPGAALAGRLGEHHRVVPPGLAADLCLPSAGDTQVTGHLPGRERRGHAPAPPWGALCPFPGPPQLPAEPTHKGMVLNPLWWDFLFCAAS